MSEHTTTTAPDLARELAPELRELEHEMRTYGDTVNRGVGFVSDKGSLTASTLDALVDENVKLCEAVAHYLDTGLVSARNALSEAIGREVEPPSAPGSWRNAAGVLASGAGHVGEA